MSAIIALPEDQPITLAELAGLVDDARKCGVPETDYLSTQREIDGHRALSFVIPHDTPSAQLLSITGGKRPATRKAATQTAAPARVAAKPAPAPVEVVAPVKKATRRRRAS